MNGADVQACITAASGPPASSAPAAAAPAAASAADSEGGAPAPANGSLLQHPLTIKARRPAAAAPATRAAQLPLPPPPAPARQVPAAGPASAAAGEGRQAVVLRVEVATKGQARLLTWSVWALLLGEHE